MPLTAPSLRVSSVCAYRILLWHNVKNLASEISVLVVLDSLVRVEGILMGSN